MNARMLAAEFRKRGYRAEAWFLMNAASVGAADEPGIRILNAAPPRGLGWLRLAVDFVQRVQAAKPRAIIGFHPLANILGAIAARACGATFVASQRNPAESQTPLLGRIEACIGSTPLYRRNIAVSHAVVESYSGHPAAYRRRMIVVHNGTPALPQIAEDQAECRRSLNLPQSSFLLGSLGRLAPQKNVGFLIGLLPGLPKARLAIAGEGPDEAALRAQAQALGVLDRVQFVGPLTGEDVTRFYRAVDVFLMPSLFEGFGRALVEALQQGAITIATDLPVTREVAGDAATLLPLQSEDWVTAIYAYEQLDIVAKANRKDAGARQAANFGISAMVDGYLNALDLPLQARR